MDWNLVLEFIITVATIAVAIFLVPWLKEKLGAERAQQLEELIWKAVQAAEQLFGAGNGAEKKAYVVEYLEARGVDAEAVDADIEAAVLEVNEMVKEDTEDEEG